MVPDGNRGLLSCFDRSLPIVCQVLQHRSRKDRGGSWPSRKSSGSPPQPCLARPTVHSTAHRVPSVEKRMRFFRRPRENVAEVGRRLFHPALAPHRARNGTDKSRPLRCFPSGVNEPVRTHLVEFGVAESLSADCLMCGDTEAIALKGNGADALAASSSRVVMKSHPPDATPEATTA